MTASPTPEPFRAEAPEDVVERVLEGVRRFPWDRLRDAGGWSAGTDIATLRRLADAWISSFDWRAIEAQINRFPNFRSEIDGIDLHFIRVRGSAPRPLLLTHGWPGSFLEFLNVIEPLAHPERFGGDPADGFDVIVPSLPGFGYSAPPSKPMGPRAIASLFNTLMTSVLGYSSYIAQGGDWGSAVSGWIGHDFPEHCDGVHLNMALVQCAGIVPENDEELAYAARREQVRERESAYAHLQATKPQSLAIAMLDNPIGVAGWILEKFAGWSDVPRPQGAPDLAAAYSDEQLLANIMLYLVTDTFQTSTWIYKGRLDEGSVSFPAGSSLAVPTGIAAFPDPVFRMPPRSWVSRSYNVVHWSEIGRGGHFAAMEAPAHFTADLRAFARTIFDQTPQRTSLGVNPNAS